MQKKLLTTAARKMAGYKPAQPWLSPADQELFREACQLDGRKLTQFLLHHGRMAARKIIREKS